MDTVQEFLPYIVVRTGRGGCSELGAHVPEESGAAGGVQQDVQRVHHDAAGTGGLATSSSPHVPVTVISKPETCCPLTTDPVPGRLSIQSSCKDKNEVSLLKGCVEIGVLCSVIGLGPGG